MPFNLFKTFAVILFLCVYSTTHINASDLISFSESEAPFIDNKAYNVWVNSILNDFEKNDTYVNIAIYPKKKFRSYKNERLKKVKYEQIIASKNIRLIEQDSNNFIVTHPFIGLAIGHADNERIPMFLQNTPIDLEFMELNIVTLKFEGKIKSGSKLLSILQDGEPYYFNFHDIPVDIPTHNIDSTLNNKRIDYYADGKEYINSVIIATLADAHESFSYFTCYDKEAKYDTLYYNDDRKGLASPHFASYYRVFEQNPDSKSKQVFRDYYITGQIRATGNYVSIDKYDDANSVFDGEMHTYYRTGNIAEKFFLINGLEEGEKTSYLENGNISSSSLFHKGKLVGLYSEYDSSGLCMQKEYCIDGSPRFDYYTISNNNGFYSKISDKDGLPIYSSPSSDELSIEYYDNDMWQCYNKDGIYVAASMSKIKDFGSYFRVFINVSNNSFFPIEFNPDNLIASICDKNGNELELEIQSAQQYKKRIERTQNLEKALLGFANGLSAASAGYSYSTTSTYSPKTGYSFSTTTTYNPQIANMVINEQNKDMANLSNFHNEQKISRTQNYISQTIINPGESISGYFNIKHKRGNDLKVILPVAGADFLFEF